MNLIINAELTEPPSEVAVFRDVTLYSSSFLDMAVLLLCNPEMKDLYWYWLRKRGAFDFVSDIVGVDENASGIKIAQSSANIVVKYLRNENLNYVISRLKCLK
tara:strand:+ start:1125 stop:1433 length:309 start_codon:yes stop_codon:yes gene_type:complete